MDKENDILMEELLVRYYDGTATEEEVRKVEAWMNESAENRQNARRLYALLFATDTLRIMKGLDTEDSLRRTKRRIAMRHVRKLGWMWMQRVAAVLFLPLVVAVFINDSSKCTELSKKFRKLHHSSKMAVLSSCCAS